jgi:hypothetical protein
LRGRARGPPARSRVQGFLTPPSRLPDAVSSGAAFCFSLGADADADGGGADADAGGDAAAADALGAAIHIPALPYAATGDLVARDVERTFGELEGAARAPPEAREALGALFASSALAPADAARALTPAMVTRLRRRLTRVLLATGAMDRGSSGTPYTQVRGRAAGRFHGPFF